MLARLRHHAIVGRNDEKHVVYAARPCQHRVDEALVAGHVDEADTGSIGQGAVGKAEVD